MIFERHTTEPRPDWREKVNDVGMYYHTVDDKVYWNESAYYRLDEELVNKIESATNELHGMCLELVQEIIQKGDYRGYDHLTNGAKEMIEASWRYGHPSIYGRFDLGIDGHGNLKMFEYNADTPTSLLEASVVQWNWVQEKFKHSDQFNSIHERLIETWTEHKARGWDAPVYFTTMTDGPYEDWANVHYLMETASLAGLQTHSINMEMIGWHSEDKHFVDLNNLPMLTVFKLYPWEWMLEDEYAKNVMRSSATFIEPPWKMLLSTKVLCARLYDKFKGHPLLLPAYFQSREAIQYNPMVWKPLLGREGHGVNRAYTGTHPRGQEAQAGIVQEKMDVVTFDGLEPVIGSWVVGNYACGIGIREDHGITTNNSAFVPHLFY